MVICLGFHIPNSYNKISDPHKKIKANKTIKIIKINKMIKIIKMIKMTKEDKKGPMRTQEDARGRKKTD